MACVDATKRTAVFHVLLANGAGRVRRNTRGIYEGCGSGYLRVSGAHYDGRQKATVEEGVEQVSAAIVIEQIIGLFPKDIHPAGTTKGMKNGGRGA